MGLTTSMSTLAVAAVCGVLASYTTACGSSESGGGANSGSSSGGSGSGSGSGGGSGSSSGGGSGSSSGSGSGGGSGSGSGSDSGGATEGGGGDNACYSQASDACINCCYNNHPTGGDTWDNAFYTCVCQPSNCATQCAQTDCSNDPDAGAPQPGDPCDLCEQQALTDDGGGVCAAAVAAACNPVADCVAIVNCVNNCP